MGDAAKGREGWRHRDRERRVRWKRKRKGKKQRDSQSGTETDRGRAGAEDDTPSGNHDNGGKRMPSPPYPRTTDKGVVNLCGQRGRLQNTLRPGMV